MNRPLATPDRTAISPARRNNRATPDRSGATRFVTAACTALALVACSEPENDAAASRAGRIDDLAMNKDVANRAQTEGTDAARRPLAERLRDGKATASSEAKRSFGRGAPLAKAVPAPSQSPATNPRSRRGRAPARKAANEHRGLAPYDSRNAAPDRAAESSREAYDAIVENDFLRTDDVALSTFSIDVDTASYSNVRRILRGGALPPAGAVRIEELLNYFEYDYPKPKSGDDAPFSTFVEAAPCPWNSEHRLVHLGLRGKSIAPEEVPPRNLVFLLDVSGSMRSANKLPLLKSALEVLVHQLNEDDSVAIVVYAGASGLVLPATHGDDKQRILEAMRNLQAGGSTNGGAGIQLAYRVARENFRKDAINRVILATDGDFNVGTTNRSALTTLIEKEREGGVFLTVLGLGTGNLQDATMEMLADKGNGNYAYLDSIEEAKKVLGRQAGGTLITIAKDVKIQVEFNPRLVQAYRLIGYENRKLAARDFADDKKDAGEIGAGHSVTALYEIVPVGVKTELGAAPKMKYQSRSELTIAADSNELMTLRLRYKSPTGSKSQLISQGVVDPGPEAKTTSEFDFAAGVAMFGMLLRNSKYAGTSSFTLAKELAQGGLGPDAHGYRKEFLTLVDTAAQIRGAQVDATPSGSK